MTIPDQTQGVRYSPCLTKSTNPAERVRDRIRRWLETANLSQREFVADVDRTQVWLQKVLAGTINVRLKDLDMLAHAMRTSAAELVRSDEERYQLELTPTEIRLLEALRRRPEAYSSLASLLRISLPSERDKAHDRRQSGDPSVQRRPSALKSERR